MLYRSVSAIPLGMRFTKAPLTLRRPGLRLDNLALVPASMLPFKEKWQAANRLPEGDVLIILPQAKRQTRETLEKVPLYSEPRVTLSPPCLPNSLNRLLALPYNPLWRSYKAARQTKRGNRDAIRGRQGDNCAMIAPIAPQCGQRQDEL